jgi:glycosyltransferase involved in cell wall biosynthesis
LKQVAYLISNINKAIAFEWIVEKLDKEKFGLSFILLNAGESELEAFLVSQHVSFLRIDYCGLKDLPRAIWQTAQILRDTRPNAVHCHLFHATLIGLMAAKLAGIKKRVYTRHHGTYNWQYNKKGVCLDVLLNGLATDIVAISENVRNILVEREKVNHERIHLIHHGFKLDEFEEVGRSKINDLRQRYVVHDRSPIIGVIARWFHLKGIQYIIPAFKKLLKTHPNALLVLANANGPYKTEIEKLLHKLPAESYQIIKFENDLFALYQLFDIYVHTPINPTIEAFGQTYVEALAAGIPSIFTLSGVAPEFIQHEKNALVVPFCDSEAIYQSMIELIENKILRIMLTENGKSSVQKFALGHMIEKLEALYQNSPR